MKKIMFVFVTMFLVIGCDEEAHWEAKRQEAAKKAWVDNCLDTTTLLATTAGSPDKMSCTNKLHRMRVQLSSSASNEEFGAVVFCECQHLGEVDAGLEPR